LNALPQPPYSGRGPLPAAPRPDSESARKKWKRIAERIALALTVFTLLSSISIVVLLHSQRFHAYLLRTAQQKASEALGSQVQARDFDLHWAGIGPSVDLYSIIIHGAPPYADPPLLQADALHLGVTITSLLHKQWYLNDIRIEHPVVRILAGKDGHTNLPAAGSKNTKPGESQTSIFDLGIRHLLLERGEIYYNDRKNELSADLHDLSLQSSFELLMRRYSGTLSYRDGHLQLKDANPVVHSLNARFSATPEDFKLESAELTTANSRLSIVATVHDYANPQLHATYQAQIDGSEFRRVLNNASLPVGIVQSAGTVDYAVQQERPLLSVVTANGDVRSTGLLVGNKTSQINIKNIGARYSLNDGNASITDLHAQLLGGGLAGAMTVRDLAGSTRSHLSASLHGVSIAELQRELQNTMGASSTSSAANQIALSGRADATADATWGKTTQDLLGRVDVTLQANAQPAKGGTTTPINGVIHARYAGRNGQLSFDQSYLRTAQTSINLNGTTGNNTALQVRVNSNDLHELETIAEGFQAPGSSPIGIYGSAALVATVSGSTHNPQVAGQLTASNLRVRGTTWKLLRANLAASLSQIRIQNGELDSATRGRVTFDGTTALQQWSFTKSSQFQVRFSASQINAADLLKSAGSTAAVSGILSADITASGTQLAPLGHGTIGLASARISGEPIRAIDLKFQGTGNQVNANLNIDLPAGPVNGNVVYEPNSQAYTAELHAPGIHLDQLETVKARNLQIQGVLDVNVSGRGTIQDPQMQAVIEVPQLQIRDQTIRALKLQSSVANHVANFTLDSEMLNTRAGGHGTIQLTGDYQTDASFDTQSIPLAPLVEIYAPSLAGNVTGQTELHATLRGPLKDKTKLEAHLQVPQLAVNYKNTIQLAAEAPIRADYANGVFKVQHSSIRGTGTELTFEANVPMAQNAPASMLLHGSVDLRLAQLVSPDITSAGLLQFDIDSKGQRSDPNVQGQIKIVNASFATVGAPLGLQNGNGVLTLTRNRLNVTQFQGSVGGGKVTASGGIVYRPQLQFDLAMAGQGVRVLYNQSLRTTLSSHLSLTGSTDDAVLTGQIGIDQLSFASDFDLSEFVSQFGGDSTPPPVQGFSQNLRLDVGVQTPGGLNLTSRTLSLAGSANLRVRGTAADPVLLGRLNLSDGDLIYSGNRYKLQGGTVDFTNASRTQPVVDMSVNTTIDQYDIQMHFWGPADHLQTNYASDPALPPADIINLIAFGKTSEADAANPTPPGDLGAQSLVASQVSNQITNRVEKLAGISQLSVDPVLGSSTQSPGARVAIQQRVTSKIFVTFATDVTSTDREDIKLEYQLSRKTSFNAVRDQNGGFSFETTFRKQW
jgi:translocation and assembly module TamB